MSFFFYHCQLQPNFSGLCGIGVPFLIENENPKLGNFMFLNFVLKLTIPLPYCQSVLTQMLLDLEALSVCMFVPSKKNKAKYHLNTYLQAFFKNSIHSVFH